MMSNAWLVLPVDLFYYYPVVYLAQSYWWHRGSSSERDPVGCNQSTVPALPREGSTATSAARTDAYLKERDSGPFPSGPGHHSEVVVGQHLWFPEQAIL